MLDLFVKGGPIMFPLAGCSLVVLALIVERYVHFHRAGIKNLRKNSHALLQNVQEFLVDDKPGEAIQKCKETSGPIAAVLKELMEQRHKPILAIKEAVESVAVYEVTRLKQYLMVMAIVATIAPLLGLFGTVTGLIKAFIIIQQESGVVNPALLAGGIWEAMITTAAGLAVAIPTHMFYQMYNSVINHFVVEMEYSTTALLQTVVETREK